MKQRIIWVALSILLVLGILGVFGCKAGPTTTTTTAPPAAKPSPAPGPAPSPSPVPSPAPSPKPSPAPTTAPATTAPAPAQPQVIKWVNQSSYVWGDVPARYKGYGYYGSGASGIALGDFLKKLTGGRLVVETVPPSAIVAPTDVFSAVEKGTVDAAWHGFSSSWEGIIPEGLIEAAPSYAWQSGQEYWDAMVEFGMANIIREAYAEHNIFWVNGPLSDRKTWFVNFVPSTPDSLKGKKYRAWGMDGKIITALGGIAVPISGPEMYMAVKLGTVDGVSNDFSYTLSSKLEEVVHNAVIDPILGPTGISFLTNQKSLDKLPADIKEIVKQALEIWPYYWTQFYATTEMDAIRKVSAAAAAGQPNGIKLVSWSAEDAKKVYQISANMWDKEIGTKNARTKKLVELLKAQMKEYGRL